MKRRDRRFSLDSIEYSVGGLENGGLLGKPRGGRYRRASDAIKSASLEEAQQQFLELRSLNLSQQTIAEERLDHVDGSITNQSFQNHNKTFHKIFTDIPEEEDLTHAFTCALQKEVLYHGKLYVSSQHICFYSTVLLKATKVIIEVESIQTVRKKNTAKVVPNALSIITNNGDKYLFVSLRNRDSCFQRLLSVCPNIQVDNINSPQMSQDSIEREADMMSSHSSQDESVSRRTSVDDPLPRDSPDPDLAKPRVQELARTSSSQESSHSKDGYSTEYENAGASPAGGSWMSSGWEKVKPFVFVGESRDVSSLLLIYVLLLVLLLLSSGYIGLRIVALEEQLSALSSLHEEYKET
ncbi:GRAM domain-containing protein 2B-like [Sardina pilchardus]|uniref:GRAM domain-containing protein 2B-like n=1 Tax=Sardina pilchardus TaxID=27697 RepID=UPI002E1343DD